MKRLYYLSIVVFLILCSGSSLAQDYNTCDLAIFRPKPTESTLDRVYVLPAEPNGSQVTFDESDVLEIGHGGYHFNRITSGDFNGDGLSDIAYLRRESDSDPDINLIVVYLSNGKSFQFLYEFVYAPHENYDYSYITSGDYTGDGCDDLAVVHSINSVTVFESDGVGFSPYTSFHDLSLAPILGITSGNFNGDEYDDIAYYRASYYYGVGTTNRIKVWESNGVTFSQTGNFTYSYKDLYGISSGNFDGDGNDYDDLALIREHNSEPDYHDVVIVLISNGNCSSFSHDGTMDINSTYDDDIIGLTCGDFNDDDNDDIAYYHHVAAKDEIHVWYSQGSSFLWTNTKFNFSSDGPEFGGITCGQFDARVPSNLTVSSANFFPRGWYIHTEWDDLNQVNTNMNMAVTYEDYLPDVDILAWLNRSNNFSAGINTTIEFSRNNVQNINASTDPATSADFSDINTRITSCLGASPRPNILGWYLCDEPRDPTMAKEPSDLRNIYVNINAQGLPVLLGMNDGGWLYKETLGDGSELSYASACDVALWWEYPLRSADASTNKPGDLREIHEQICHVYQVIREENREIPFMAILQGFGERAKNNNINITDSPYGTLNYKNPTEEELRYMVYSSIVHGARGIGFFCYGNAQSLVETIVNNISGELVSTLNVPDIVMNGNRLDEKVLLYLQPGSDLDSDDNGIRDINYIFLERSSIYYLIVTNDCNNSINDVEFYIPGSVISSDIDILCHNYEPPGDPGTSVPRNTNYDGFEDTFERFDVRLYEITFSTPPLSKHIINENDINEKDQIHQVQSQNFNISQNYPNPFNPSTAINYSLPERSYVEIRIFNGQGQEIKTLINERQTSGNYEIMWDGTNNSGQSVPSGVYFYQIKAGTFIKTNKMLLIK